MHGAPTASARSGGASSWASPRTVTSGCGHAPRLYVSAGSGSCGVEASSPHVAWKLTDSTGSQESGVSHASGNSPPHTRAPGRTAPARPPARGDRLMVGGARTPRRRRPIRRSKWRRTVGPPASWRRRPDPRLRRRRRTARGQQRAVPARTDIERARPAAGDGQLAPSAPRSTRVPPPGRPAARPPRCRVAEGDTPGVGWPAAQDVPARRCPRTGTDRPRGRSPDSGRNQPLYPLRIGQCRTRRRWHRRLVSAAAVTVTDLAVREPWVRPGG